MLLHVLYSLEGDKGHQKILQVLAEHLPYAKDLLQEQLE